MNRCKKSVYVKGTCWVSCDLEKGHEGSHKQGSGFCIEYIEWKEEDKFVKVKMLDEAVSNFLSWFKKYLEGMNAFLPC